MAPRKRRPPVPPLPGHKTLSAGLVDQYRADIRTVTTAGQKQLAATLNGLDFDPQTDSHRAYLLMSSTLRSYVSTYAEAVATRSAQFFDKVAKEQGVDVWPARNYVNIDPEALDVKCKVACKAKSKEAAINECLSFFDYEMRQVSMAEIYEAAWAAEDELDAEEADEAARARKRYARQKRRKHVRFARVPSGAETCSFCLTLASRGFVYHSRETAGLNRVDHAHAFCDCVIVPSFLGEGGLAVPGYDYVKLYEEVYPETEFYVPDDVTVGEPEDTDEETS